MNELLTSEPYIDESISEEQLTESFLSVDSFSSTDIDYSSAAFSGFGVTAAICLISLGVAVLLKLLQRTSS